MNVRSAYFPEVTLLITHYNRSASLEHLLVAFSKTQCRFAAIVVSDDGSKPKHLQKLTELRGQYGFELVLAPKNAGLGNNINKGQDAVKTEYTLYVQEDFRPTSSFVTHFYDGLDFMKSDSKLDMVRFYAFFDYPVKVPVGKGYSELRFNWGNPSHLKFFCYSDHPHLRRSSFFEKFGRYAEGKSGDSTELGMAMRFIRCGGRALFFDQYTALFDHVNSEEEPSTMSRSRWRESSAPMVRFLRFFYLRFRWLKNTVQLLITRPFQG